MRKCCVFVYPICIVFFDFLSAIIVIIDKMNEKNINRRSPQHKWTNQENVDLVQYLLESVQNNESFEKPTAAIFYNKFISKKGYNHLSTISIKNKVRFLKERFIKARNWKQNTGAGVEDGTLCTKLEEMCPNYFELEEIFGSKYISQSSSPDVFSSTSSSASMVLDVNDKENCDLTSTTTPQQKKRRSSESEEVDKMKTLKAKLCSRKLSTGTETLLQVQMMRMETELKKQEVELKRIQVQQEIDEKKRVSEEKIRIMEIEKEERLRLMELESQERLAMHELDLKYKRKENRDLRK